jgi:hypothetical protein
LGSPASQPFLALAAESTRNSASGSIACAAALRREITTTRAALVLEQARLRARATAKFATADRMFFTARGLEQATDEWIARYKARRIAAAFHVARIADLCCGIGGDLAALAALGQAVGVDRDAVLALFAAANAGCEVAAVDAANFDLAATAAWHIDPDRRPQGRRTTRTDLHEPSTDAIDALRAANPHAAVKLAPAASVPRTWSESAELEWIGHSRQCQQLVAWFGRLAAAPGLRRATMLPTPAALAASAIDSDAPRGAIAPLRTLVGSAHVPIAVASRVLRYVCEPHAAVLAARLHGHLAAEHGLTALAADIPYFTTDTLSAELAGDAALALFETIDVLPFHTRRLKAELRRRNAGVLEIKKRGVDLDPESLRRQLAAGGSEPLALIISPTPGGVRAILCRRLSDAARRPR